MAVKQRTALATFDQIPGNIPEATVSKDVDKTTIAQQALKLFSDLDESKLSPNSIWRDYLALTGYYRTIYSRQAIAETWKLLDKQRKCFDFVLKDGLPRFAPLGPKRSWYDVDIAFKARNGSLEENCAATVSVIPDADGKWQIWMLRTWLENFTGHGHPDVPVPAPSNSVSIGTHGISDPETYDAVVVGAGQAGLATAGRLQALGIKYLLLEQNAEVGDNWANRYRSLRWHTAKEYGNLPFGRTFPPEDEYMLPTKRIGAGFKSWAERHGINVRTSSSAKSASYDSSIREWTVTVTAPSGEYTVKSSNLILAIGPGHKTPIVPSWANPSAVASSSFKGKIIHAFLGYHGAQEFAGKRGIVIGTANTGHDIAEDLANAGMQTTIVQRNPTFVFPAEWLHHAQNMHYNEVISTAEADRQSFTYPNKILREMINFHTWAGVDREAAKFDALEEAGFKLDRYGDIYTNIYVRFGGHYVDIGCSDRIAKGEIKVKAQPVVGLTEDGLKFEDGEEVGADLIVLCTGFDHDFRNDAADIVGREVADTMDDFWGIDEEGEIRGLAKPAGHPNLYYHGGDVRNARWISRFLALQIQADVLGQPLQPFTEKV